MASTRKPSCFLFLLLCVSLVSTKPLASDMSIISYDEAQNVRTQDELLSLFESWMVSHGKTYTALEKPTRLEIFKDNLKYIEEQNGVPNRSYKLGLNEFADLTNEEYRGTYCGSRYDSTLPLGSVTSDRYEPSVGDSLPDSIDWGERGAVVGVKNQGYEYVPRNNEQAIQKAVANQPVSVLAESGGRDFQLYVSGIFSGPCGTDLDHGMVIVGYGSENGEDYWIVRNSWGPNWGEGGYVRMRRNIPAPTGLCGIAIAPNHPITPVCTCPEDTTCCCLDEEYGRCFQWGCCPFEGGTCCEDGTSCCPREFPVCNIYAGTCSLSRGSPFGVKAMKRIRAKPIWKRSQK